MGTTEKNPTAEGDSKLSQPAAPQVLEFTAPSLVEPLPDVHVDTSLQLNWPRKQKWLTAVTLSALAFIV